MPTHSQFLPYLFFYLMYLPIIYAYLNLGLRSIGFERLERSSVSQKLKKRDIRKYSARARDPRYSMP